MRSLTLAVALLALFVAACGSRLSQESFDKIREGMTQKEVRDILGEPSDASGGSFLGLSGTNATWKDAKTTISVQFLNDKVVSKHLEASEKK